jgi:hypothetical protein
MKQIGRVVLLTLIVLSIVVCDDKAYYDRFQVFLKKYHKRYDTTNEYMKKFEIYMENVKKAQQIFKSNHFDDSEFMDMSEDDFGKRFLTRNIMSLRRYVDNVESYFEMVQNGTVGQYYNWVRPSYSYVWPYNYRFPNVYPYNYPYPLPNPRPNPNVNPQPRPNPNVNPRPTPQPTPQPNPRPNPQPTPQPNPRPNSANIPDSFDWRAQGAVGAVKNQGSCASCWAFTTTGNLEGLYFIKYGKLLSLSEQQLVDCDTNDNGCNGGMMDNAYTYLQNAGGSLLESEYPYTGRKGQCRAYSPNGTVKVTGMIDAGTTDENYIKQMLYNIGPLGVVINASTLQYYTSGIFNVSPSSCPASGINHGVLLVGYGSENGVDYWIAKNSWGASWGEQGFFRIARGKGLCGINNHVVSAKIA